MIGIENGFVKEREADLGDGRIGIVWRNPDDPVYQPADKSMDSWFKGRTHQVLKTIYNKETGKLEGVMSFMEEKVLADSNFGRVRKNRVSLSVCFICEYRSIF